MRGIDELDHYQLLEISTSATNAEVERAYRLSQETYADDSLALYSVFESSDAAAIRQRLDEAYRILSDPELRVAYDEANTFEDEVDKDVPPSAQVDAVGVATGSAMPMRDASSEFFDDEVEEYDTFDDEGVGDFDGLRLRRTRLFRGYEIEDISEVTKVSGTHLRNIESENFLDLPADVYVRGFVTAYAKTIGLDTKIVVPSYMARVKESRSADTPGRFLDRN
jgi:DnaJ-class molecular chaperone